MSSADALLRATINTLKSRLGSGLIKFAAKAQVVPEKFREELDAFQKEVLDEAERLDQETQDEGLDMNSSFETSVNSQTHLKIDQLRAKLKAISKEIEELP